MARRIDTPSTDRITASGVSFANAAKGWSFWTRLTTKISNARWIQISGNTLFAVFYSASSDRVVFQVFTSGTDGEFSVSGVNLGIDLTTTTAMLCGGWDGNVANPAVMYAAEQGDSSLTALTVTTNIAPTGTADTDVSATVCMGNQVSGANPLDGWMEHVHVFDRVPSQAEFEEGLLASTSGAVGGSSAGRWVLDATDPADDLSGNSHDGTVTGTTLVTGATLYSPNTSLPFRPGRSRRPLIVR